MLGFARASGVRYQLVRILQSLLRTSCGWYVVAFSSCVCTLHNHCIQTVQHIISACINLKLISTFTFMANTHDGWVIPDIHFHDALMKACLAQLVMDAAFHQRTLQKGVFHCFQELHGMLFPAYQHVQLEPSPHKACFKCVKWRSLQAGMFVEELMPGTVRACCYSPSRPGTLSVIFRTVYVRTCVHMYSMHIAFACAINAKVSLA